MNREVVVTGVGAVTPLGIGARTLYERWRAGASGIQDGVGRATEFDPTEYLTKKEVRRADRFTQFALVSSDEALREAGWDEELPYEPGRIGCLIGTGIGGIGTLEHGKQTLLEKGPRAVSPLAVPLMMGNAAAGAVSMRHGLKGHSYSILSACAASAHSIGAAARMIQTGDADAVVTGGSEAALTPLATAAFAALDALSEKGVSRPFDAQRDGFVMGEGAAVLILEDGERARERGATILGTIAGYGASSDANHLTAPEKNGAGAVQAMEQALRDAGYGPQDVVYVNAHGTSTPLNDAAEADAISKVFGVPGPPVTSTKGVTGHALGAGGALEAAAVLLSMEHRLIPPTMGTTELDPDLSIDLVTGEPRPWEPGPTLSNSFGFGGHNACLALGGLVD
jgi:3-oxoacyl-[acyl-carrier-protein] synthase II